MEKQMSINRRLFTTGLGTSMLLPGCTEYLGDNGLTATAPFESLVRQIKHDVGTYIFQHQNDPEIPPDVQPCSGQIAFAINKVEINVTATFDRSMSGNAGLKVPIDVTTFGMSGSYSTIRNDTITTSLTIWPITAAKEAIIEEKSDQVQRLTAVPPPAPDFSGTPITNALNQLRNDLIRTANTPPCFDFGKDEQSGNVVKWAFTISKKAEAGAKFSLLLFAVGADGSVSRSFANTIEVNFIASGRGFG